MKAKKCSNLAPPMEIFFNRLNEFGKLARLIKNQLTKSDPKRTGGDKCPPSCQLGFTRSLKNRDFLNIHYENKLTKNIRPTDI